jgi:trehalose synthase
MTAPVTELVSSHDHRHARPARDAYGTRALGRYAIEMPLATVPLDRMHGTVEEASWERLQQAADRARESLSGRTVWSINSTAFGGGIADMLRSMLPYTRAEGIDARWLVIAGNGEFFRVTKRLHNLIHGHPGDGDPLSETDRRVYEKVVENCAREISRRVMPGDLVVLHDPQTLGLAPPLRQLGASVIWRCHIGSDSHLLPQQRAWGFLDPYLRGPDALVFSHRRSVPPHLEIETLRIIPPSIDPCSIKNQDMSPTVAAGILERVGLVDQGDSSATPVFARENGSRDQVRGRCDVLETGPRPRLGADQLVVHLSRWDRLKDPLGVLRGFAEHTLSQADAHLILAGPALDAVADDPEQPQVLDELAHAWRALPHRQRRRVTIACLPVRDIDENAAIVNALQRHADVIAKKSLGEGFGLGVTEALWKRRAVVASRVGGISEQIEHGVDGVLVGPHSLRGFGEGVACLLADRPSASRLGDAGHEIVRRRFLHPRHLAELWELLIALAEQTIAAPVDGQPVRT